MKPAIEHIENEIDRVLSREDDIFPSSGFAASVMEAVRRESTAPPPIPFPWKRAWPIILLASLALALGIVGTIVAAVELSRPPATSLTSLPSITTLIPAGAPNSTWVWTALSLVAAFISVKLSMRLAGGGT